jgi:hypothetical protein
VSNRQNTAPIVNLALPQGFARPEPVPFMQRAISHSDFELDIFGGKAYFRQTDPVTGSFDVYVDTPLVPETHITATITQTDSIPYIRTRDTLVNFRPRGKFFSRRATFTMNAVVRMQAASADGENGPATETFGLVKVALKPVTECIRMAIQSGDVTPIDHAKWVEAQGEGYRRLTDEEIQAEFDQATIAIERRNEVQAQTNMRMAARATRLAGARAGAEAGDNSPFEGDSGYGEG